MYGVSWKSPGGGGSWRWLAGSPGWTRRLAGFDAFSSLIIQQAWSDLTFSNLHGHLPGQDSCVALVTLPSVALSAELAKRARDTFPRLYATVPLHATTLGHSESYLRRMTGDWLAELAHVNIA